MQYDLASAYSQGSDSTRHMVRNERLLHEKGEKDATGRNHVILLRTGRKSWLTNIFR